jgi:Flp pilus assembly protein TadB
MSITLTRSPYVAGSLLKFKIWLNNKPVTKIALGEEKTITLPEDNSIIQIKQFSGKSNTLTVNDGDQVEISNGTGLRWMVLLAVLFVPIVTLLEALAIFISLLVAITCFFILLIKTDSLKLTKINNKFTP